MLTAKISAAALVILSSPTLWSGRVTSKDINREMIAGHKVLKIHRSTRGNSGWTDLALPFVLFQDPSGTHWVGGVTNVYSFDQRTDGWTSFRHESGNSLGSARSIAWSADGKIWVHSLGLYLLSVVNGNQWQKIEAVNGFAVQPSGELLTSNSGRIWLAQKSGLYRYDNGKWQGPITPPAPVEHQFKLQSGAKWSDEMTSNPRGSIIRLVEVGAEDHDGQLWMGTRRAVIRFSPSNQRWAIYRLPSELGGVLGVYEDAIGRIWFCGPKGGVARFDKATSSWSVHDLPEILRKNRLNFYHTEFSVSGICEDKSGQVLFATDIGLISFKEKSNEWNLYTIDNSALPDNYVSALLIDKTGRIWVGTGKGIVVLDS